MTDHSRLIEHAFPLKQTSLDSLHEKNVRHGHISTIHIWPARRPLAASRAAIIATLLHDPGTPEARQELCEKIGGRVIKRIEKKQMPNGSTVEREKLDTEGGILHWGRETENAQTLEWFRQEIRKTYGGRAPKVLDPFSGGGAIPLEALRLGCETTAVDLNPVAWFILKCTLEYPQKLAGHVRPLPSFIHSDEAFMSDFFTKAKGMTKGQAAKAMERLGRRVREGEQTNLDFQAELGELDANFAWHVRAWSKWVLERVRRDVARYYPTYADFEPLKVSAKPYERQPMRLVPLDTNGVANGDLLNKEFSKDYLEVKGNPRWVTKRTVAYLWARTATCKNCRAVMPLLKTRWLARTNSQRVIFDVAPSQDRKRVVFSIREDVPHSGGNNAQRREHDKQLGRGTMSRSGAKCPCCSTIMTMEDLQHEGKSGRLGSQMTAVATDGPKGKEFRQPTPLELSTAVPSASDIEEAFADVPFGKPDECLVEDAKKNTWCVQYGIDQFSKLYTPRQLVGLGRLVSAIRAIRTAGEKDGYSPEWLHAITCYLAATMSRLADFFNCGAQWKLDRATINHLFVRYALPLSWDYAEGNILGDLPGSFDICARKVAVALDTIARWDVGRDRITVVQGSSKSMEFGGGFDAVITDPPYYNAIGYAVLMDYFYVWLRRITYGLDAEFDRAFREPLSPKWSQEADDGELIDDASRHGGDQEKSKAAYERGMEAVFRRCGEALNPDGRLVIVFAHKDPIAWEALVAAIIRAGYVVDGSWPIQTEQATRMRALSSAALSSSVWLVCRKRPASAGVGWDNRVLEEMKRNIGIRLREYWDAGIKGPDFIWAATGPALEAFSKYPVVRRANGPGTMTVTEFLSEVRRLVVDYVVGQVLSGTDGDSGSGAAADRLDEPTAYYLLHRNDFGLGDAPVGTVILYAVSCGLSDRDLCSTWELAVKSGDDADADAGDYREEDDDDDEPSEQDSGGKGSTLRLKRWNERTGRDSASIGYDAPGGRPVPLIDRVHRLMQLYKAGDIGKVDTFLDEHGLRRHELFKRVIQSLIEVSRRERGTAASGRGDHGDETILLEALSNHISAKGAKRQTGQRELGDESGTWSAATSAEVE
ncbi:MAG: DUF1156 domain-containing protein [Planctomycetes bacterium]|nr:DUF1156 domain-containing protein [Planctomycetota bacterium]